MAFKYSCFISYCHGQGELTQRFIEQLIRALKSYLEPWLDEEIYIDEERLLPGYNYNEQLAEAICQSVCMIVVYSPRYERHAYCLREYTAMERIEEKRRQALGQRGKRGSGMIIPIIFRGLTDDLPPRIQTNKQYCDFTKFTTATLDINQNPEYIAQIEKIARVIYGHYKAFDALNEDVCSTCDVYELPPEDELQPWRAKPQELSSPFPGREVEP
jgi:hypothetical protein